MQVPETPSHVQELDLMKRLDTYAKREATWDPNRSTIGPDIASACRDLHTCLVQLVERLLGPLLDRTTARELETFTMHDRSHGLKVAHLMWHILEPDRREHLTPPEIGLLVATAFLHDVGMSLDRNEREERLDSDSDLWDKLEVQESQKVAIEKLRTLSSDPEASEIQRDRARKDLTQAEEALLSQDTRERHATRERYEEVVTKLKLFHQNDPVRIPDVEACLSFGGDSFLSKLIDVCVSHNQDAETLVQLDEVNFERLRFPSDYPVGRSTADLHMVAAAIRLADILDFDRERTPPVLFHYLLPGTLDFEDRSVLEWSKHLAISNWHIEREAIVFRGRSNSHVLHHAVVQFCSVIADEIAATRATFGALEGESNWPFNLPSSVEEDIHEEGYRYIPYRFELDDERIYELLMGGAIYDDPRVAVRELVQNAVDACKLRDAITRLHEPYIQPSTDDRITVRYEEATSDSPYPRLSVTDTGTGMDALILERYFLKVGRSYYRSADFNQHRLDLRKRGLDFAPVSEFGIGFLSSFLMANRVVVETAMWEPIHDDSRQRILQIDGPTRLIRLDERRNEGPGRFKGTRVTLYLSHGSSEAARTMPPHWEEIVTYLKDVCQDLPYRLNLEYVSNGKVAKSFIDPQPLSVVLPRHLDSITLRIPVADEEFGLEGEITLINQWLADQQERKVIEGSSSPIVQSSNENNVSSALPRGGFRVSKIPGLPFGSHGGHSGRLRLTWTSRETRRYIAPNLSRNAVSNPELITQRIERLWLTYLLEHVDDLSNGQTYWLDLNAANLKQATWLEQYNALTIYRLAKTGWIAALREDDAAIQRFVRWEENHEGTLPISLGTLVRNLSEGLLNIVLPRFTTLQLHPSTDLYSLGAIYHVTAPEANWQDSLREWRSYITEPVVWGPFADYVGDIKDLLFYDSFDVEHLNSRYQDKLSSFDKGELTKLPDIFERISRAQRLVERVQLTDHEITLMHRVQDAVGDLEIAAPGLRETWRVDTVILPNPASTGEV